MTDVIKRLEALENQGEDYIWRAAKEAKDEIERLEAYNRDLVDAVKLGIESAGLWQQRAEAAEKCISAIRNGDLTPYAAIRAYDKATK